MPSLLDVAPQRGSVSINGTDVDVFGVSAEGIISLLSRFPELQGAFAGGSINAAVLIEIAPRALSAIIAAGCGCVADVKAEAIAAKLGASDQVTVIAEIARLTFPEGIGPFVERFSAMAENVKGAESLGRAPDTNSP